jgi:hypothetical protein
MTDIVWQLDALLTIWCHNRHFEQGQVDGERSLKKTSASTTLRCRITPAISEIGGHSDGENKAAESQPCVWYPSFSKDLQLQSKRIQPTKLPELRWNLLRNKISSFQVDDISISLTGSCIPVADER